MKLKYFILALALLCGVTIGAQECFVAKPRLATFAEMLDYALKYQQRPHRLGADGEQAFDCSSFTRHCYRQLGIELSRTAKEQAEQGDRVRRRRLKEGDLVFFSGQDGKEIAHVGIVFKKNAKNDFDFIHVSSSKGVILESSRTDYFNDRYVTARRITADKKIRRALKHYQK